jgi:hypothetical protein
MSLARPSNFSPYENSLNVCALMAELLYGENFSCYGENISHRTGTFQWKVPRNEWHSDPYTFYFLKKVQGSKFPSIRQNRQNVILFHETIPLSACIMQSGYWSFWNFNPFLFFRILFYDKVLRYFARIIGNLLLGILL